VEWWRELFETPAWQAIQLAWEEADDTDDVAAKVERALALAPGDRVLDVPCGTGRVAKRLADLGQDVVGIDAIPAFLRVARAARVSAIRADMRTSVVRPGSFDAAICLWGSFGYFDDDGNIAQARAVAEALAPGGRYLIDTIIADSVLPAFEPIASWRSAVLPSKRLVSTTPIPAVSRRRGPSRTGTIAWSAPRSCGSTPSRNSPTCWPMSGSRRSRR